MRIRTNGEEVILESPVTVEELLILLKVETPQYVTVQINDEFIDRGEFLLREINEGDEIEFLYFMGGGKN
jgi:sulfur carrier protein